MLSFCSLAILFCKIWRVPKPVQPTLSYILIRQSTMHHPRLLIILLSFLITAPLLASDFEIIKADDYSLDIQFQLPPFTISTLIGEDGKPYQRLHIPEWGSTTEIGAPELPITAGLFQVPATGEIQLTLLEQVTEVLPTVTPYPVSRPISLETGHITTQFTRQDAIYSNSQPYPAHPIHLDQRAHWRGTPVLRVKITPFQWHPQQQTLHLSSKLRFRLQFSQPLPPLIDPAELPNEIFTPLQQNLITGYRARQIARQSSNESTWGPRYTAQFSLSTSGLHRLDYATLSKANIPDTCLAQGHWLLASPSQQIVPQVISQSSQGLKPGDSLLFYVNEPNSPYTTNSHYQFTCWQLPKARLSPTTQTTAPIPRGTFLNGQPTTSNSPLTHGTQKLRFENNRKYWLETPNSPTSDYWFWERLNSLVGNSFTISIPKLDSFATEVNFKLAVQGEIPEQPHHVQVYLNQQLIKEFSTMGNQAHFENWTVPKEFLLEGDNELHLALLNQTNQKVDFVYFNWLELTFNHALVATDDQLKFSITTPGRQLIQVAGFSDPDIRVFDLSNPAHLKEILNTTHSTTDQGHQISFETEIAEAGHYYAVSPKHFKQISEIKKLASSELKRTDIQADYLLIAPEELLYITQPLLTHRESQGLTTKAISVERIYQEFGFGFPTPEAIKAFLRYTYYNWQSPAPQYVLLVGEGSLDYKNYLRDKQSRIPPHLINTIFGVTPTDNWYVSLEGDDPLPEMMIGRLPGHDVISVSNIIKKLVEYETQSATFNSVLLIADEDDDDNFEKVNEQMTFYLKNLDNIDKLYLKQYADAKDATAQLIEYIDQGQLITHYIGHGHITLWAKRHLFESKNVNQLTNNNRLTFLLALNCLNAYFADPRKYSLGEEFLLAPDKGAFAVFSSTGLSFRWHYEKMGYELFKGIFSQNKRILGELISQAKVATYNIGVDEEGLTIFTLIGDPASRLQVEP